MSDLHHPAIIAKRERAHTSLLVERIRDGTKYRCTYTHGGRFDCYRDGLFLVWAVGGEGPDDPAPPGEPPTVVLCYACLSLYLYENLLAPDAEYAEQERDVFRQAQHAARREAHQGCDGGSKLDPDGLCQRAVVALCSSPTHRRRSGEERVGRCARHAPFCRRSRHTIERLAGRPDAPKT